MCPCLILLDPTAAFDNTDPNMLMSWKKGSLNKQDCSCSRWWWWLVVFPKATSCYGILQGSILSLLFSKSGTLLVESELPYVQWWTWTFSLKQIVCAFCFADAQARARLYNWWPTDWCSLWGDNVQPPLGCSASVAPAVPVATAKASGAHQHSWLSELTTCTTAPAKRLTLQWGRKKGEQPHRRGCKRAHTARASTLGGVEIAHIVVVAEDLGGGGGGCSSHCSRGSSNVGISHVVVAVERGSGCSGSRKAAHQQGFWRTYVAPQHKAHTVCSMQPLADLKRDSPDLESNKTDSTEKPLAGLVPQSCLI